MAGGGCFCGAVRFRIELPSKWVAHCHCSMCRRAHGAAFVTWVGSATERATIEDGDAMLRWFASSPGAERGFCTRCGSTLFFRSQRWPGELHIVLANFEDPVDRAPQLHFYDSARVDWCALDPADGLPRKG
jgi:hypothetical protein